MVVFGCCGKIQAPTARVGKTVVGSKGAALCGLRTGAAWNGAAAIRIVALGMQIAKLYGVGKRTNSRRGAIRMRSDWKGRKGWHGDARRRTDVDIPLLYHRLAGQA